MIKNHPDEQGNKSNQEHINNIYKQIDSAFGYLKPFSGICKMFEQMPTSQSLSYKEIYKIGNVV